MSQNPSLPSITINEPIESAKLRNEVLTVAAKRAYDDDRDKPGDVIFDNRIAVTVSSVVVPSPAPQVVDASQHDKTRKALDIALAALAKYSAASNWRDERFFRVTDTVPAKTRRLRAAWEIADRAFLDIETLIPGAIPRGILIDEDVRHESREVDV